MAPDFSVHKPGRVWLKPFFGAVTLLAVGCADPTTPSPAPNPDTWPFVEDPTPTVGPSEITPPPPTPTLAPTPSPAPNSVDVDNDGDGFTESQGDCNDREASIHPSAVEICDTLDNNCDGQIDEGVTGQFYPDGDNDAYGAEGFPPAEGCEGFGYAAEAGD